MARKRQPDERKLRTRAHVLADLSVNYVERRILLCGFAVNRLVTDYGIDLGMLTFTDGGEVENGHVLFQVKGTDSPKVLKDEATIAFRVELADIKSWQDEWSPVILVIYDGVRDRAWWLYMQQYLDEKRIALDDLSPDQDRVTVRIPMFNRLNRKAIKAFRRFRTLRRQELKGDRSHGN